jgi:protein TonB
MAFFPAHKIHETHLEPGGKRERLVASLVALAAHALLVLLLLLSAVHAIVTPPSESPVVLADLSSGPPHREPMTPPTVQKLHIAPVTVTAPEITIQPEARTAVEPSPAPATMTPTPSSAESAWSTAASGGAPGAGAGTGAAAGGGAGGFDINPYLARVAAHIQHYLRLPYMPSASVRNSTPQVLVHLVWRRDGTVMILEVAHSSDHSRIDDAAVDAIRRAQPLPPFPPELRGESINGRIPVLFIYRFVSPQAIQVAQPVPPQSAPAAQPAQSKE